ncbi:ABC transporter substrate-binding protein [Frankia sp. AiPs1]|uniref:ABC transporter substrate-binding protein n=1 Tax=Frankia sp. AiPs1 TaxID=573493 RepID=UPI00204305B9|nr:ABC transporter substrate-binding protein [Frankia sp. AiPs1]MCM3921688.1 ABC transporter substrate-binding protein [Frankia sp. AiPs1]
MVIGDLTSTIPFKVPEVVPVARGVLRGFPNVRIETCDAKGTSGGYQICARQAINEKVAGVIQGFVTAQDQTALTKAGIPVVGVSDDTSPNSFPVSSSFALYVSLGVGLAKTGCTKLGIVYLDGSDFLIDYIKRGFESRGGQEVARAPVAANAADLAPAVAKLTGAGATCVAVSLVPSGAAQALTALRQSGRTLTIGGISAIFNEDLLSSLGSLANGLIVVDSQLNTHDTAAAGIGQVQADARAVDSKTKITEQAVVAWIAARLVGSALRSTTGEVTPASLTAALNGLRGVDLAGVAPPWTSQPLDNPSFRRVFNHYGVNYEISGGKPVRKGEFYDIAPILRTK